MTFQISRRGKQYLETAQTLLRAARTMTDSAIADQLKAPLPTTTRGEERKLRIMMRLRHSLDRQLRNGCPPNFFPHLLVARSTAN